MKLSQQQSGITSLICLEDNTGNVVLQVLQLRYHLEWGTIQKRVAVGSVSYYRDWTTATRFCDRAFPVAAAKLWNELPYDVTASVSDCFSSLAENLFVSCILSGFIICTARYFAIAVYALTLTLM